MIQFKSKIVKLEHKKRLLRAWREGDEIKTTEVDLGWFMLLEGSWEMLYVGQTQPKDFEIGDHVDVTITPSVS